MIRLIKEISATVRMANDLAEESGSAGPRWFVFLTILDYQPVSISKIEDDIIAVLRGGGFHLIKIVETEIPQLDCIDIALKVRDPINVIALGKDEYISSTITGQEIVTLIAAQSVIIIRADDCVIPNISTSTQVSWPYFARRAL